MNKFLEEIAGDSDIPKGWSVSTLRDVLLDKKSALNPRMSPNEEFEYYSIPAYQEDHTAVLEKGSNILSQKLLVTPGTVLFGKLNPRVHKVWLVQEGNIKRRKIASTEFIPLVPDLNRIVSEFLFFLCWTDRILSAAQELVSGSTPSRQRVDVRSFLDLSFLLPPISEQRAIAYVLWTVQQSREATEKIIAAAKGLKQSLMEYLFTYGPVPFGEADKIELKETEIGVMPATWNSKILGDILTLQRGKDLPIQQRTRGNYPVVGSSGIVGYHAKFVAKGPGVTVGRSGSVGEVNWVDQDYWPLNTTLWVKDFHGNFPKFIFYFLKRVNFSRYSAGVSVPTLNRNLVHPVKAAIPTRNEQEFISFLLDILSIKIECEEKKKNCLEILFSTLLHNLISGQIRVHEDRYTRT